MTRQPPKPWDPATQSAPSGDPRLHAPATDRDAILDVLRKVLPASGRILEIASGSGEHILHFARALPALSFQPSDPSPQALASIAAWRADSEVANISPPLLLDAAAASWPACGAISAMLCINMIHIAPWAAAEGLFRQAGAMLSEGAPLYLYGPYRRADRPLEQSNAAFDDSLRARNPEWGLRDLGEVAALATTAGFSDPEIIEMPANNLSLIFRKQPHR
jgi:hypothetical protein